MRKSLEALCLFGLALLYWITRQAFNGSNPLPDRVPTHFDAAGNANAWGPPSTLWFLPAIAVALYLFVTLISLLPTRLNSAKQITPETRARLQALIHQMVAWIKLELVCLFLWIQWSILQAVQQGAGTLSPMIVVVFMVAIFTTLGLHFVAMIRITRAGASS
jgi:uncharacterized membrane protein